MKQKDLWYFFSLFLIVGISGGAIYLYVTESTETEHATLAQDTRSVAATSSAAVITQKAPKTVANRRSLPVATTPATTSPVVAARPVAPQGPSITLSIEGVYTDKQVPISEHETLLALLQELDHQDPSVHLKVEEYSGLGALVVAMGSSTNSTDKQYWQYKVNGILPQIGASGYQLKPGDKVEWYFGPSQQ